jgi:hypothetical protein
MGHPMAYTAMHSYVRKVVCEVADESAEHSSELHRNIEGTKKMQAVAGPIRGAQNWDGM